jgi:DNA-directed RNA polymerase specialized sigma24 family protein
MRISEIAQLQNVSEVAIRQRLKRGRDQLAAILVKNK